MKDPVILLTNDDGWDSSGLAALRKEMSEVGRLVVVAPYEEQSGVGHGLTIRSPLRVFEKGTDCYALTGTPVDCVIFAIRQLMDDLPQVVISGINHGPNLGDDIHYSGTVAGAREAALYGVPSFAASLATRTKKPNFKWSARLMRELVREFLPSRVPRGVYLNVNIPEGKPRHYRYTCQGSRLMTTTIEERRDQRGKKYYWIGKDEGQWLDEPSSDYQTIREGIVSVTPMHRDHTDFRTLKQYSDEDASK